VHFLIIEERLRVDPYSYVSWIEGLGAARLHLQESHAALAQVLTELGVLMRVGGLSPYACGEAMQICISDLVLIEELAQTDVPPHVLSALRYDLVPQALDLVVRLLRNMSTRALTACRPTVHPRADGVSQLAELTPRSPTVLHRDVDEPVLVVASAGRGTRLRSTIPKGLIPVGRSPMIAHVVGAARIAGISRVIFVLKHRADVQTDYVSRWGSVIVQDRAEGTGHSALVALASLRGHRAPVILSYSDLPFLRPESFERAMESLRVTGTDFVLSTFVPSDADKGAVLRDASGAVTRVGQPRFGESASHEGDAGLYALLCDQVFEAFGRLRNANVRREFALPDVVAELVSTGRHVRTAVAPSEDFQSVNTPRDLTLARLRTAVGAPNSANWREESSRSAAVAFFAAHGADRSENDEILIRSSMNRIETHVGPILDLRSDWP
jgi:CTP:molybdopterin cytidylyltransferase MocA